MKNETKDKPEDLPGDKPGQEVAVYDPGTDAGAGLEDVGRDEYAIPFLTVLDPKSRFVKPAAAGGIPGANAGALFNTSTNEIFDGEIGIDFIPVHRDHHFVEWIPKNEDGSGGGFVGIRSPDDPLALELQAKHGKFGKLPTSDGHELAETFYLYGLVVADGVGTPVVIGFSSTQIKKYRNFMTRAMGIKYQGPSGMIVPALWAHVWRFGSMWEKKGKAYEGFGWRIALKKEPSIESRLKISDPLYVQARGLYEVIKSGRAVVKHEEREPGEDRDEVPM